MNELIEKINKLKKEKIDVILFADISPFVIQMLKGICSKYNIKIVADSVEWYSPEQFKLKNLSPGMILKNIENKYAINKDIRVIAISSYLEEHFKRKGCICTRIPVILDIENLPCEKKDNKKLNILYAGSPGKKDYLHEMLKGVLKLDDIERMKLKFVLAGVSDNYIQGLFNKDELNKLEECIVCLGRVSRNVVLEKLLEADFTVLLRATKQRYAKAGFPTKVVESLGTGTPVILNITSDLGYYIKDKQEGLIVKDCTDIEFANTLREAINLDKEKLKIMKFNARQCAEQNFSYIKYSKALKMIIEEDING